MSRLLKYINEQAEFIQLSPKEQSILIKKDCKYYLNLTKNTGPFNRAVDEDSQPDELIKKSVRQNRRSLGMNQRAFKKFNDWLGKNDHVRRDKSVSASSAGPSLAIFGNLYYFFPIGKFNYTWVKTGDINRSNPKTGWVKDEVDLYFFKESEYGKRGEKRSELKMKKFPTYFTTNKGIKIAHKNKYEIWFDCKEYYLVNRKNKI